jgi:hypothetical protein
MIAGTVRRFPDLRLDGQSRMASSLTLNLHTAMPVRLR